MILIAHIHRLAYSVPGVIPSSEFSVHLHTGPLGSSVPTCSLAAEAWDLYRTACLPDPDVNVRKSEGAKEIHRPVLGWTGKSPPIMICPRNGYVCGRGYITLCF